VEGTPSYTLLLGEGGGRVEGVPEEDLRT
jgi:hypothetical protein